MYFMVIYKRIPKHKINIRICVPEKSCATLMTMLFETVSQEGRATN